ncbi:MAG: hypothetical protein HZA50_18160 [Planctomycetes bacterium]|nr:hypothetical protein [Planctomycetota bacterium]
MKLSIAATAVGLILLAGLALLQQAPGANPPPTPAGGIAYVWWEGEAAKAKSENMSDGHVFDSANPKLSGGKSIGGTSQEGTFLEYEVDVPAEGNYTFYVRKFWHHGPFKWKFNSDEFKNVDRFPLLDSVSLRTHCINWICAGKVKLPAGKSTLRIEAIPSKDGKYGAFVFDCFVLTNKSFIPSGLVKPGQKLGLADAGKWAFEPDFDEFNKPSPIDLRPLNEKIAGESGYMKMTPDGDFVLGSGKPVRLWCANTSVQTAPGTDDLEYHAKHLAKRGINMVRHHGDLNPPKDQPFSKPNEEDITAAQKLVAVMKKEGIYVTYSPYWAIREVGPNWGLKGHPSGAPWGMLFWDEDLQKAYKGWVKELLTRPNPFESNKTPLAKDPALAIFQIQNEDSLFFHTAKTITKNAEEYARLQAIFDKWLTEKNLGSCKLSFNFWETPNAGQPLKNSMHFLAELMHKWNADLQKFLRDECGYKGMVNAGNWRTADQVRLLDLERYSYTANEVIGVNRYTGCVHVNPSPKDRSGYAIDPGDCFTSFSCLLNPRKIPTNAKQVASQTYIISESCWVPPTEYQSEGPFLVAAYSSLNGMDGYYWFATGVPGYSANLGKWVMADPCQMGSWPAAALMFRKGFLKKGEPAVHEERALADMFDLKTPVIAEDEGFDSLRDTGNVSKECAIQGGVNPLAYLVGPVEVKYGGDPAKSTAVDFAKYIDDSAKTVKSITGEIELNHDKGLCTVNAPKAQGVTGFIGKIKNVKLADVEVESGNEYATVLVVPLDDKPIKTSAVLLVQITTVCRPYGFKTSPSDFKGRGGKDSFSGFKIDSTGAAPWNVANTDVTVSVANAGIKKATLLDINGYPVKELELARKGEAASVKLPADAMYVVLGDPSAAGKASVVMEVKPDPNGGKTPPKTDVKTDPKTETRPAVVTPPADDQEAQAKRKLAAAKIYVTADPAKAKELLRKVITDHPNTEAAKEARKELGKLN